MADDKTINQFTEQTAAPSCRDTIPIATEGQDVTTTEKIRAGNLQREIGSISTEESDAITLDVVTDTWKQVLFGSSDECTAGITPSHSAGTLTVGVNVLGLFPVFHSLSASGINNATMRTEVRVGGAVEIDGHSHAKRKIGSGGDVGNMGGPGSHRFLGASAEISLWVKSDATGTLSIEDAKLMIGG